MVKGEDAVRRKKNKVIRKRMQKDSSSVSARVAAIIAAKQRRKSGKRRMCEGMCFGLPTPEDPFNDRHGKKDFTSKKAKTVQSSQRDGGSVSKKDSGGRNPEKSEKREPNKETAINRKKGKNKSVASIRKEGQPQAAPSKPAKENAKLIGNVREIHAKNRGLYGSSDCPSKFLILCLNSIQNALLHDDTLNGNKDKHLLVNTWGFEFWKCGSAGLDILETTGTCSSTDQVAWMASTAADTIARKEKEGLSVGSPFLLFLVPSQEKAIKVRSVCKPLKSLGIHTVSVHPGASLEHQIHGLRSCEPEFLVSTPERLLELISSKAIDISGVSLLVVDGFEAFVEGKFLDNIKSIRQSISGDPQTVLFGNCFGHTSSSVVQDLLVGPISRLSLSNSIISQSACIVQSIHLSASEDGKLSEGIKILDQACSMHSLLQKVLFIVETDSTAQMLLTTVKAKGYPVLKDSISDGSQVANRSTLISVTDKEHLWATDIGEFDVIIVIDFFSSMDDYIKILTRMARHTVNGILHSFFSSENTPLAKPLIELLERCDQTVPIALMRLVCPEFVI
ncbi:probable ATP-dependent RNA helicase ddx5 isoform X2 [Macadamia integrifolia]|uniref:probable ATP-dependent RNA helicase ddx5 isoform X2 n=1 Tax=Macadamia integrifolia TaxID=60698 RepID=UPI001C4EE4CE|nr:probable ATP-dependent RNA helicase ddx5 isoform X2 [Macadamia integrifolia]